MSVESQRAMADDTKEIEQTLSAHIVSAVRALIASVTDNSHGDPGWRFSRFTCSLKADLLFNPVAVDLDSGYARESLIPVDSADAAASAADSFFLDAFGDVGPFTTVSCAMNYSFTGKPGREDSVEVVYDRSTGLLEMKTRITEKDIIEQPRGRGSLSTLTQQRAEQQQQPQAPQRPPPIEIPVEVSAPSHDDDEDQKHVEVERQMREEQRDEQMAGESCGRCGDSLSPVDARECIISGCGRRICMRMKNEQFRCADICLFHNALGCWGRCERGGASSPRLRVIEPCRGAGCPARVCAKCEICRLCGESVGKDAVISPSPSPLPPRQQPVQQQPGVTAEHKRKEREVQTKRLTERKANGDAPPAKRHAAVVADEIRREWLLSENKVSAAASPK